MVSLRKGLGGEMTSPLKLANQAQPTPMPEVWMGEITGFDELQRRWLIDHQFTATPAMSLMVKLEPGDKVSFIQIEGTYVVTQILTRSDEQVQTTLHSDKNVQWLVPKMSLKALESLEFVAANKITMTGKTLVQNAVTSLVQQSENLIQQVNQFSATARGLMRLSGKQQIITAEDDVKIDGKRINMG